jgi:hypothetical protein
MVSGGAAIHVPVELLKMRAPRSVGKRCLSLIDVRPAWYSRLITAEEVAWRSFSRS